MHSSRKMMHLDGKTQRERKEQRILQEREEIGDGTTAWQEKEMKKR